MKKKLVKIYLDEETINDLKLINLLEGCSVSFIVRTIINDYTKYYLYKNKLNNEGKDVPSNK